MNTKHSNEHTETTQKQNEGVAIHYNHIRSVIAVMSGKGGVGKTFVTGLLASSLVKKGYQVGILDADITGPSIPTIFGLHGPITTGKVGIQPLTSHSGIKLISMNFLLSNEDQPVVWRGPLISKAIQQLWGDVEWGDLDFLLVDLPPGTSDVSLTIMQSLPVIGVVMVTTPQGLSSLIVRKAVNMTRSLGLQVLGIVENMAYFICPESGHKHLIFGESHSKEVAATAGTAIIAKIPIDPEVAKLCDAGKIEEVDMVLTNLLLEGIIGTMSIERNEPFGQGTTSA